MEPKFVQVLCDVYCEWEGLSPIYRVYINDELFAERTWIWDSEHYLEELIQINAPPGEYTISYDLIKPHLAMLECKNMRIQHGPGRIKDQKLIII